VWYYAGSIDAAPQYSSWLLSTVVLLNFVRCIKINNVTNKPAQNCTSSKLLNGLYCGNLITYVHKYHTYFRVTVTFPYTQPNITYLCRIHTCSHTTHLHCLPTAYDCIHLIHLWMHMQLQAHTKSVTCAFHKYLHF
jgi:hypothetical protein